MWVNNLSSHMSETTLTNNRSLYVFLYLSRFYFVISKLYMEKIEKSLCVIKQYEMSVVMWYREAVGYKINISQYMGRLRRLVWNQHKQNLHKNAIIAENCISCLYMGMQNKIRLQYVIQYVIIGNAHENWHETWSLTTLFSWQSC